MIKIEIRYIEPTDDRAEISNVYEESWKYAYKGIISQNYLDSIPKRNWISALENCDWETFVFIDNDKIVGTSNFCNSRFEQFPDYGEIISIYFLPEYIAKGYGYRLMESVVSELEKQGYDEILL